MADLAPDDVDQLLDLLGRVKDSVHSAEARRAAE
jgi:hypothetical protein